MCTTEPHIQLAVSHNYSKQRFWTFWNMMHMLLTYMCIHLRCTREDIWDAFCSNGDADNQIQQYVPLIHWNVSGFCLSTWIWIEQIPPPQKKQKTSKTTAIWPSPPSLTNQSSKNLTSRLDYCTLLTQAYCISTISACKVGQNIYGSSVYKSTMY